MSKPVWESGSAKTSSSQDCWSIQSGSGPQSLHHSHQILCECCLLELCNWVAFVNQVGRQSHNTIQLQHFIIPNSFHVPFCLLLPFQLPYKPYLLMLWKQFSYIYLPSISIASISRNGEMKWWNGGEGRNGGPRTPRSKSESSSLGRIVWVLPLLSLRSNNNSFSTSPSPNMS